MAQYMKGMYEALYYRREDDKIRCLLCPRGCLISEGERGFCNARVNLNNKLYSQIYARASSIALDPVEKKPLYHFYPGSLILSLGTIGCNFRCPFCQNWQISQREAETQTIPPDTLIEYAKQHNSIGIAYTYNEPLIWYEYVLDTAKLAKENNLKNVLVTNGYINPEPLSGLLQYIDALNIDLKAFDKNFYEKYCQAKLDAVLETIKLSYKSGTLVELTNLIIPTLNDGEESITRLVEWVCEHLSDRVPVHFTRYFPHYKFTLPPTPLQTLFAAYNIANKYLKYVYLGNVLQEEMNTTYCCNCKKPLITRQGYNVKVVGLHGRNCKYCAAKIDIIC